MWLTGNTISLAHARTTGKHNLCNGFFVKQSWLNLTDILKLPIFKGLWLCPVTHFKKPAWLIFASDSLAKFRRPYRTLKIQWHRNFFHLPSLLENPVNGQASSLQPTSESYHSLRKKAPPRKIYSWHLRMCQRIDKQTSQQGFILK